MPAALARSAIARPTAAAAAALPVPLRSFATASCTVDAATRTRAPLLEIRYRIGGRNGRVFAKYEQCNMTGSVKDRMAAWILARAYERGEW